MGRGIIVLIHLFSLLLLAFAVSLDGFGVGVTYGMRRIRIPLLSICIIAFCTGIVVWLSMGIGTMLIGYMPPLAAKSIGAGLLMIIGAYALLQWWKRRRESTDNRVDEEGSSADAGDSMAETVNLTTVAGENSSAATTSAIINLELKRLGIVIQILRTPQIANVDRSGVISS